MRLEGLDEDSADWTHLGRRFTTSSHSRGDVQQHLLSVRGGQLGLGQPGQLLVPTRLENFDLYRAEEASRDEYVLLEADHLAAGQRPLSDHRLLQDGLPLFFETHADSDQKVFFVLRVKTSPENSKLETFGTEWDSFEPLWVGGRRSAASGQQLESNQSHVDRRSEVEVEGERHVRHFADADVVGVRVEVEGQSVRTAGLLIFNFAHCVQLELLPD